ncbi:MAG: hypothetical protein ACLPIC_20925 [Rhodoblastus sp.]|uniref:hypothetical protein n=1 Tax=Rhodoblastus sp. TaxID=1962975 RepID=UPI003F98FAC0
MGPKVLEVEFADFEMVHRTPFDKAFKLTDAQNYAFALTGKTRKPNLPYGLDIYFGPNKVMNLEWDDAGANVLPEDLITLPASGNSRDHAG